MAAGVGLEARGTLVTLWPRGVVRAALAHASAPPPAGLVPRRVEAAALGVVVALAAWGEREGRGSVRSICLLRDTRHFMHLTLSGLLQIKHHTAGH